MHTLAAFRIALASAFLAAALAPSSAPAAPAPPDTDAAAGPVTNPREGLDRVVTLNLHGQSLGGAVAQLRDKTKLHIVLDAPAVAAQLGSPARRDARCLTGRPDRRESASRPADAARPCDLTFVVIGDSIIITTEDAAGRGSRDSASAFISTRSSSRRPETDRPRHRRQPGRWTRGSKRRRRRR